MEVKQNNSINSKKDNKELNLSQNVETPNFESLFQLNNEESSDFFKNVNTLVNNIKESNTTIWNSNLNLFDNNTYHNNDNTLTILDDKYNEDDKTYFQISLPFERFDDRSFKVPNENNIENRFNFPMLGHKRIFSDSDFSFFNNNKSFRNENKNQEDINNLGNNLLLPINNFSNNINSNKRTIFDIAKSPRDITVQITNNNGNLYIFNSNIHEKIELSVFNYEVFKKNYKDIQKKILNTEPQFFSIETIKRNYDLSRLWSGFSPSIFMDEDDFDNTIKNGVIYGNLFNILNKNKAKIELDRAKEPDEMSQKLKTFLLQQILNSTNSYEEFLNNKLEKINKKLIYQPIKADFLLFLLGQKIYSLISNDIKSSNVKCNYEKIKKIINEYNEKGKHLPLIEHLCLTLEDCLDIFVYKREDINNIFENKLIEFLNKVHKDLKYEEDSVKKDYIAAMILLAYNFKRLFYLKQRRLFRKKKQKIKGNIGNL